MSIVSASVAVAAAAAAAAAAAGGFRLDECEEVVLAGCSEIVRQDETEKFTEGLQQFKNTKCC